MSYRLLLALMLVTGLLVGCDDDDDSANTPDATNTVAEASDDVAEATDPFVEITPSGLSADVFSISGRGTVLALACNSIDGAASYTFTTSTGLSQQSDSPSIALDVDATPPAGSTFSVYATNDDGLNTRTAEATIN